MDREELSQIVMEVVKELQKLDLVRDSQPPYHVPEEAQELADSGRCLWCKEPLEDAKPTRGLHSRCYRALLRDLEKRNQTMDWAVSIGAALPETRPGPKAHKATRLDELIEQRRKPSSIDEEHQQRLAAIKAEMAIQSPTPAAGKVSGKPRKKNTG